MGEKVGATATEKEIFLPHLPICCCYWSIFSISSILKGEAMEACSGLFILKGRKYATPKCTTLAGGLFWVEGNWDPADLRRTCTSSLTS